MPRLRLSSADLEALEAFGLLLPHLERVHFSSPRPGPAEFHQLLHGLGLALEHGLNGPVVPVPSPAGDAGGLGPAADGVAEEDALDPAAGDDAPADGHYSSSSYSETTPAGTVPPNSSEAVTGGDCTETQQRSSELELA